MAAGAFDATICPATVLVVAARETRHAGHLVVGRIGAQGQRRTDLHAGVRRRGVGVIAVLVGLAAPGRRGRVAAPVVDALVDGASVLVVASREPVDGVQAAADDGVAVALVVGRAVVGGAGLAVVALGVELAADGARQLF